MCACAPVRVKPTEQPAGSLSQRIEMIEGRLDLLRSQVRQAQQLATLGTAAATIAHEVRNLLTPILSYADAALKTDNEGIRRKALQVTLNNARMLVSMSDRILHISATRKCKPEPAALHAVVDEAAASLCRDLDKDGIRFSNRVDNALIAKVDPLQIQQVLFNLFLNAREAMASRHNGRITVTGARHDERIAMAVEDTGGGIPPDLLPHVFDSLRSSKSGKTNGKARCSGLGLALCRDLVEENGGTIEANSEWGKSTTFTITLPAA